MPINLGNGFVPGNIILKAGIGGGGGGGASVNVPANSILFSSTGTDICGNVNFYVNPRNTHLYNTHTNRVDVSNCRFSTLNCETLIGDPYYNLTKFLYHFDWNGNDLSYDGANNIFDISANFISDDPFGINISFSVSDFNGFPGASLQFYNPIKLFDATSYTGTFEFFIKFTNSTVNPLDNVYIFNFTEITGLPFKFYLQQNYTNEKSLALLYDDGTINELWSTTITLDTTLWYYFALSVNDAQTYIYFNPVNNNVATRQSGTSFATFSINRTDALNLDICKGGLPTNIISNMRYTDNVIRYIDTSISIPQIFFASDV